VRQIPNSLVANELLPGTTNAQTYCSQVQSLQTLVNLTQMTKCPSLPWVAKSTVRAHEDVHLARLGPALNETVSGIERAVDSISVPLSAAKTRAEALLQMKSRVDALNDSALDLWAEGYSKAGANDEAEGEAGQKALQQDADIHIKSICAQAKASEWTTSSPCSACP
jgi:hypothetical protein